MSPVEIVVAWEDTNYQGLKCAFSRARKRLPGREEFRLSYESLGGNTNCVRHVKNSWPKLRKFGKPRSGPVDHIVYVLDADALGNIVPTLEAPMGKSDEWYPKTVERLRDHLRELTILDPDRIHVHLLRWAKESVLLAMHDQIQPIRRLIGFDKEVDVSARLSDLYQRCEPDPRQVADREFIETFRNTKKCQALLEQALGLPKLRKSDQRVDDAIDAFSASALEVLLRRIPDLRSLAEKVQALGSARV